MLILGIECTAHTFGIGIVDSSKRKVLFNEKSQFKNDVGMDLRKLSEFHLINFDSILIQAKKFLLSINKDFSDLDLISFAQGPGIGNSLKFASLVAKTLSMKYGVKAIGVNHIKAHLEIGKMLTGFKDPLFLYVSGVNTQVVAKNDDGFYKIYGESEDIGLGNLIDSFARLCELDFPGGPIIEKRALNANRFIELPYTVKGMNVSLAGMYSNFKQKLKDFDLGKSIKLDIVGNKTHLYDDKDELIDDLCYSLQETCFAMMMEICERAMTYTQKKEFLIVGGVAANLRLGEMAKGMCELRDAKYDFFDFQFALDNGAMIAWQGYIDKVRASFEIESLKPLPYINIESDL